jgi:hypothetical protein
MFQYTHRLLFSALIVLMLCACSNSEEPAEKGRIARTTDKIVQETITEIRTPINQANLAKKLTDQHNNTVEKAVHQVKK